MRWYLRTCLQARYNERILAAQNLKSAVNLLTMCSNSLEENPHLVDDLKDGQLKEWRNLLLDIGDRISIYQPEQDGLTFLNCLYLKLLNKSVNTRKERLVAACRAFALEGFDYGFAGHLTVRDPEHTDLYWTNPMCVHFDKVNYPTLFWLIIRARLCRAITLLTEPALFCTPMCMNNIPDIISMCHAHTTYGVAWCATGRPIDPVTQDACAFFEDHVVIGEQGGQVAVENHAGSDVAKAFTGVKAALHQNHGLLTASRHSIEAAAFWFIALERCCQQQLDIAASGVEPIFIPRDRALYSREHVGSEYIGWLHFQTIWNKLIEDQPDMFD